MQFTTTVVALFAAAIANAGSIPPAGTVEPPTPFEGCKDGVFPYTPNGAHHEYYHCTGISNKPYSETPTDPYCQGDNALPDTCLSLWNSTKHKYCRHCNKHNGKNIVYWDAASGRYLFIRPDDNQLEYFSNDELEWVFWESG